MKFNFCDILYSLTHKVNDKGHSFSFTQDVALMIILIRGIALDTQLTRDLINIC